MKKTTFILCLLSINLLAVSEVELKEMNKNISDLSNKYKNLSENKKSTMSIDEALKTSKDVVNLKDAKAKIKKEERIEETINDPLKRSETVNKKEIERTKNEISKKSLNMANIYEFLSLYGKFPEEKGNLPNEKELYKLMKDKKIKIVSEKVINKPTQVKERISR